MIWLYRIQQRFSITQTESVVLLALVALFNVGLGARYVQQQPRPIPPETRHAENRLFDRAATLPADTLEVDEPEPAPPAPAEPPATVNLNTASSEQLQHLDGVGPKTAARIQAFREQHGGFRRKRELLRVRGIGPKTLQSLQAHIVLK